MENGPIAILLIEDNLLEATRIKEMLSEAQQPGFSVLHVRNLAEGQNLLQSRNFDVVLVDLGLPDCQGLESALAVRKQTKQTPIIVLTVLDDEDAAIESLHLDIQDYLLKCELNARLLTRSIRYAIHRKHDMETLRISEERFRALFRDNPTMIVTLDAGLKMLSVNPICACILGYLVEELEGRPVLELFHEDDRAAAAGQLRMCLQTPHQVYRWQFRKINKDGELLWVEETAQAVYDLNGSLNILLVCQDISERRRLEDDLKKTNMQNELLLASAGEGIVGFDLEGNQTFVNAAAAAMLGYEAHELAGTHGHSTWHYARPDGSPYPEESCAIYAAFRDGEIHSGEELFLKKDGTAFPVRYTSRSFSIDGKTAGVVLTFDDITERKRIERTLQESEELFRAVFNQAAVGIALVGTDRSWQRINRKCCDIVGYTEEEIKTLSIREITHPDDREKSQRHLQLLLEGKLGDYTLELRYIRKDGSMVWVNLTTSMMFDAAGKPAFIVGVFEDITARKHAEIALVRAKEEWERTFDSVPELIAIMDNQCRVTRMNRAMSERLGRKPGECNGLVCYEAIHGTGSPPSSCPHADTMKDGLEHDAEMRYDQLGGVFLASTTPLLGPDGNMVGVVHMARDITEQKKAEEEIKRLNADLAARAAELEDANRELETFNYTVAHDLRQPLNVISSYCQVIKEMCNDKLEEECRHYLQETYEGTMRMNRLIEALLQFSRLAHSEIKPVEVDLSALANEVAMMLKQTEPERQVDFRSASGITANADENLLRLVLGNLIGNAWKYTGKREKAVIEFGAMEMDGVLVYFVRDNGTGFDMAYSDKLFVPFQRLPGAQECRGFGIGLATVNRIIRRHEGRIWAEGEKGKGATFFFTLQSNRKKTGPSEAGAYDI